MIEVNLGGSASTARSFLPRLLSTRGQYFRSASLASVGTAPMMSVYCASKAGVESLSHSLRAELAPHRVGAGIA
ncbi:SDR family NAD(P)-dependent oxidoreductase [Streptomyces sp. NPDC057418]|uniref:SDR family NAD(P)-dependent oxidoreductase n=1 Tax=Streptomyces sp. NPDC057418 TaxID=3346126 RepID=UPI0036C54AF2